MLKDKLKDLRTKEGLSQQALAEKLFVSRSAVAKWESGNGIPSDANLEAICKFFDVDEEWLLDREELKDTLRTFDMRQINMRFIALYAVGIIILFSLLVGGIYRHMHRVAIVLSVVYLLFKFYFENTRKNRVISRVALTLSMLLSIINFVIMMIPEPSQFLRIIHKIETKHALDIALSQLSSLLNILMLLAVSIASFVVSIISKRRRKREEKQSSDGP